MNIVWADDEQRPDLNRSLGEFVSMALFGEPDGYVNFTSMGVFDGSTLVAAVIYHNFERREGTIQISAASLSKRWLTRRVLREMYVYPFDQLGAQMVIQRNSDRDTTLARMLTALGFSAYPIPRLRGRDHGEIVFTLTDDAWRSGKYYEVKRGQEV